MKAIVLVLALAGALAPALPRGALAQRADAYRRLYDPNTVETVSGRVVSIEHIVHGRRGYYGEHLVLSTHQGRLVEHLGPGWFMEKQALQITPHEELSITGSRVLLGGKPALIAARVVKGNETRVLRNAQGLLVWRGSRYP